MSTARSPAVIEVHSASTGELIGQVPEASEADVDAAVAAARQAFDDPVGWSQWEPAERGAALARSRRRRSPASSAAG